MDATLQWTAHAMNIAALEFRLHLRSAAWRLTVVIGAVLASGFAIVNHQDFVRRQAELAPLLDQRQAAITDAHLVAGSQRDLGLRVIRAPESTSMLVSGFGMPVVRYWDLGPEGPSEGTVASSQPMVLLMSPDLDLEFLLRVLIGLIAVTVGVSSAVFARHRQTTKSLLSLPLDPAALALGALAGGWVTVALGAGIIIGSAVATLALVAAPHVSPAMLQSAGAVWALSMVYGAALQGAGAAVALLTRRLAATIGATAGLWLVATVIAQAGVGALVQALVPATSRPLFELQRDAVYASDAQALADAAGEIVTRQLGRQIDPVTLRLEGPLAEAVDAHWDRGLAATRQRLDSLEQDFRRVARSQGRWVFGAGVLVPGVAFKQAAMDIVGAGSAATRRWEDHVEQYQAALNRTLFDNRPRLRVHLPSATGYFVAFRDRRPRPVISDLPAFVEPTPAVRAHVRDAGPWALILLSHWILTWSIVVFVFVRGQAGRPRQRPTVRIPSFW